MVSLGQDVAPRGRGFSAHKKFVGLKGFVESLRLKAWVLVGGSPTLSAKLENSFQEGSLSLTLHQTA